MSVLGNVIWLICGGLIVGVVYIIGGCILCLTVVGIPFGLQSIRIGAAVLAPFGKQVVNTESPGAFKIIFDVIWIALFGWEIAMAHLTFALILAITIVGLPFAKQHIKLVPISLFPFSQELR